MHSVKLKSGGGLKFLCDRRMCITDRGAWIDSTRTLDRGGESQERGGGFHFLSHAECDVFREVPVQHFSRGKTVDTTFTNSQAVHSSSGTFE